MSKQIHAESSDNAWMESGVSMRSKRKQSRNADAKSQEVQRLQHLNFDKISSIQFCIDGAIGLPLSSTATRVTARLMAHDRSQVGEPSAPSFSHPGSDALSPTFDLHMGWRGSTLQPSLTIVCRIDTLERPSLEAKCMGFAALKLCVDEHGVQPLPDLESEHISLNAGQYLLPIVYGSVPTDRAFSEAIMDQLPHIHGAFLRVRLFEPNVENAASPGGAGLYPRSNQAPSSAPSEAEGATSFLDESSVAAVLIGAHPRGLSSLPSLPVNEVILDEIQRGMAIDSGEKKVVLRQLGEWIAHAFPSIKVKVGVIDPRFVVSYEDGWGALVALDMLYNMPPRPRLIAAARHMEKRRLGRRAPAAWDDKISCFKTFFRYLPGAAPVKKGQYPALEPQTELIIDDASLDLDVGSRETCPVYLDEFSRTAGIELTAYACLLVIVTAVDVLTDSTATTKKPTQYFRRPKHADRYKASGGGFKPHLKAHHSGTPAVSEAQSPTGSGTGGTDEEQERVRQEKAFKLRGLVGVYFGTEDPAATWWGIVPIMTDNPLCKPAVGSTLAPGNHHSKRPDAAMPVVGTYGTANDPAAFFVDAGTHQVPLFEGAPPEEMLTSPHPMAWLQGNLRAQTLYKAENGTAITASGGSCFPSAKAIRAESVEPGELVLSSGCSAFVSIVDPRLKRFSDESASRDPSVVVREESLRRLLKIATAVRTAKNGPGGAAPVADAKVVTVDPVQYNRLYATFQYAPPGSKNALRSRTLEEALPHNVFPPALVREVNDLFLQAVTG